MAPDPIDKNTYTLLCTLTLSMVDSKNDTKTISSDVSDDEWAFFAPYLTLMTEDVPPRDYPYEKSSMGCAGLSVLVHNGA